MDNFLFFIHDLRKRINKYILENGKKLINETIEINKDWKYEDIQMVRR